MIKAVTRYIPNILTFLRIILSPLLVFFIFQDKYLSAILIFIIICFSDLFDGIIARKFKTNTKFGAFLDVVADLIYIVTTIITLIIKDLIPSYFIFVVIIKFIEFAVTSSILKKKKPNKKIWIFDNLGKCFAIITFLLPGIILISKLLSLNINFFVNFLIIFVSIIALVSTTIRIIQCVVLTKEHV